MELRTVSQVSRDYGISARMLRYYEQMGLLESQRKGGYAYRVYDEKNITRLRQIIILRKLRIPVKHIISILSNADAARTVELFRRNINELDKEITALSTVKSILTRFVEEINEKADVKLQLLGDETLFSMVGALSFSNNQIKEIKENVSMDELNKASETLDKLLDKDVRIMYLPPMTVAACLASGEGCEEKANGAINKFVTDTGLTKIKPDLRQFGFDASKEFQGTGVPSQAYEAWISIPDDMEVPAPLIKRTFRGGMYAAHVLRAWDFQDWVLLREWVNASGKFDNAWGEPRWTPDETGSGQGFEEQLNYWVNAKNGFKMEDMQLDLLFPIRAK
ncbi:MerR family transcriptional regulator [Breznakiella homolactica]|uniref:MerR family transcriptional regulator n=1 Tax=Breznakiella homolactica TaxID=2798577 RepID=A0A7T7XKH3_9SPIR|nr:MerR family transcriptional regulator [Breznakiella homolactica]QQO07858.1 effector binding domain-containing protein [Breznakiella homolactica]